MQSYVLLLGPYLRWPWRSKHSNITENATLYKTRLHHNINIEQNRFFVCFNRKQHYRKKDVTQNTTKLQKTWQHYQKTQHLTKHNNITGNTTLHKTRRHSRNTTLRKTQHFYKTQQHYTATLHKTWQHNTKHNNITQQHYTKHDNITQNITTLPKNQKKRKKNAFL